MNSTSAVRAGWDGTSSLVAWDRYFFPLDTIGSWNQLYGSRGFLQHQSVIPANAARSVLGAILERIAGARTAPLLSVLKRLGSEGTGMLSFPLDGFTLAMDFVLEESVLPLLEEIDQLVVEAGGRIYLAKDARQIAGNLRDKLSAPPSLPERPPGDRGRRARGVRPLPAARNLTCRLRRPGPCSFSVAHPKSDLPPLASMRNPVGMSCSPLAISRRPGAMPPTSLHGTATSSFSPRPRYSQLRRFQPFLELPT